jgi:hypothetical protein
MFFQTSLKLPPFSEYDQKKEFHGRIFLKVQVALNVFASSCFTWRQQEKRKYSSTTSLNLEFLCTDFV